MDPERRRIKNLINNYIKVADLSEIVLQYVLAELGYRVRGMSVVRERSVFECLLFDIESAILYALRWTMGLVNANSLIYQELNLDKEVQWRFPNLSTLLKHYIDPTTIPVLVVEICGLDLYQSQTENPIQSYCLINGIFYTMDAAGSKCDEYFGWDFIPLYAQWK